MAMAMETGTVMAMGRRVEVMGVLGAQRGLLG